MKWFTYAQESHQENLGFTVERCDSVRFCILLIVKKELDVSWTMLNDPAGPMTSVPEAMTSIFQHHARYVSALFGCVLMFTIVNIAAEAVSKFADMC